MRFIHGRHAEALVLTLKLLFDSIHMKNKNIFTLFFAGIFFLLSTSACKKSMDELNVNPNSPTTTNPDYLFTYSVVKGMNSYITNANVHYWLMMNWNMYFANLGGVDAGKEYDSNDGKDAFWTEHYAQALMNAREVQRLTAGNNYLINKNSIARIWQVYLFSQLTDLFGDIPYSQALQGATGLNFTPAYDRQQNIYPALINELKQATAAMDPSQALFPTNADPIYQGNITKWANFANSLRLRLAMRLSVVNPTKAQQEIADLQPAAFISTNSENAIFRYNGEIRNPLYDLIQSGQSGGRTYPSKFLIDKLKSTNDPRIGVFAQVTIESIIIGIPDYEGVPNLVPSNSSIWGNYNTDASDVSKIGTWFLKQDAPGVLMCAAEVNFLKAEAALNGWWSGNAQQLYEDGVTANIQSYTGSGISAGQTTNYIASLPAVNQENILTQKWISFTFQNGYEAYAEYRRTGFPVYTDYSGNPINTNVFPNRLTYPPTEGNLNSANYNAALTNQGADVAATKVWWDGN